MVLLDTNILSELVRPAPAKQVENWLAGQPVASVFISAITGMEKRLPCTRRQPSAVTRAATSGVPTPSAVTSIPSMRLASTMERTQISARRSVSTSTTNSLSILMRSKGIPRK